MKSMLRVSGEDAIGESAPTGADRSPRALVDLLRFFELGRASDAADHHELSLLPVALAPYRDASRLKTSYPLLLPADGSPPLTMDELNSRICEALGVEGDERRRLEQLVARFELALRQLEREEPGDFVALAAEARASVVAAARVDDEKRGALSGTLQQAVATAVPVGTLLFDTPRVVEHLTQQIAAAHRRRVAGELVTELDELIERLESWLAADFAQSAEAMSPDHLKVSLGTKSDDEFDADALSSLLRGARERTPEQQRRHARIEEAHATLLKWAPLFRGAGVEGLPAELAGRLKSLVRAKHGDLAAALGAERELEELFVPFFRARRIARLEIDDVYREHAFDAYFASFGADQLDPSERRLCPPVVLTLRSEALTTTGLGALMKALGAGRPLNIVLEISALDRLDGAKEQATATALDFARMALLLPGVFVFQGSYSEPLALHAAFADALNWPGPSLVAVFTGFEAQQSAPSRYLTAAAALESRVLPTFVRRPQAGGGWAEQLSLAGNPHLEEQLSVEELALGGEE
ncbi:MAG: hypothetical protein KC609_17690, partial [Myxococcales bacterium]|nr:hypothetical protein [Myxococcales bacterium]